MHPSAGAVKRQLAKVIRHWRWGERAKKAVLSRAPCNIFIPGLVLRRPARLAARFFTFVTTFGDDIPGTAASASLAFAIVRLHLLIFIHPSRD